MPARREDTGAAAAGRPRTVMEKDGQWQVRFDGGRQQRYLADRAAVLRYVLAVAPHAASSRFEVYAETEPVRLADGSPGGRQFALAEVIDLARPGEAGRLRAELQALAEPPA
jgi:hypothetical protein